MPIVSPLIQGLKFQSTVKNESARILEREGSVLIETANSKGKTREKVVKGFAPAGKALMELLRKGFIACENDTLVLHTEIGPALGHAPRILSRLERVYPLKKRSPILTDELR